MDEWVGGGVVGVGEALGMGTAAGWLVAGSRSVVAVVVVVAICTRQESSRGGITSPASRGMAANMGPRFSVFMWPQSTLPTSWDLHLLPSPYHRL